jgi:hypothetical protein
MNSGIPLEKFPLVPQGHHHHQDHLAFAKIEIHCFQVFIRLDLPILERLELFHYPCEIRISNYLQKM